MTTGESTAALSLANDTIIIILVLGVSACNSMVLCILSKTLFVSAFIIIFFYIKAYEDRDYFYSPLSSNQKIVLSPKVGGSVLAQATALNCTVLLSKKVQCCNVNDQPQESTIEFFPIDILIK